LFSKYRGYKIGIGRTNERTDGQIQNIMPQASLDCQRQKNWSMADISWFVPRILSYNCLCLVVTSLMQLTTLYRTFIQVLLHTSIAVTIVQ